MTPPPGRAPRGWRSWWRSEAAALRRIRVAEVATLPTRSTGRSRARPRPGRRCRQRRYVVCRQECRGSLGGLLKKLYPSLCPFPGEPRLHSTSRSPDDPWRRIRRFAGTRTLQGFRPITKETFFANTGGLPSPAAASRDVRVTVDALSRSIVRSRFRRFAGTRTLQGFRQNQPAQYEGSLAVGHPIPHQGHVTESLRRDQAPVTAPPRPLPEASSIFNHFRAIASPRVTCPAVLKWRPSAASSRASGSTRAANVFSSASLSRAERTLKRHKRACRHTSPRGIGSVSESPPGDYAWLLRRRCPIRAQPKSRARREKVVGSGMAMTCA